VILSIGLVFARGASLGNFQLLKAAVYVLAALTLFTTAQRIAHVRKQLIAADAPSNAPLDAPRSLYQCPRTGVTRGVLRDT